MKIREKLLLLLILPLLCQLSLVGLLAFSYAGLDKQVKAELHAKEIIAETIKVKSLVEHAVISMAFHSISGQGAGNVQNYRLKLREYLNSLDLIASNEPTETKQILEKTKQDVNLLLDLWEELALSYESQKTGLRFSRFSNRGELAESATVAFNNLSYDSAKIMEKFAPASREFRPAAVKAREGMRNAVAAVLGLNILLVLAFAYILNKSTLSRLAILTRNMERFALSKPGSQNLAGNDELSELDKAFQEMSHKLIGLEEERKSIRAIVSHDLRAPLKSMISKTKIILSRNPPENLSRNIKLLHSEIDRLRRLANTLLDIEKMEDGSIEVDLKPVDFGEILELSTESIAALCKRKQIVIETSYPENCFISCDKDRSVQVLINFLSNSVKFAPKNTRLAIRAVEIHNFWQVEVHDQGPGVPQDKQNKLFAKFIQLEQAEEIKKEGSGLGLYICKLLIEAQKGEVGYKTSDLGGSCFYFTLLQAHSLELS